MMGLSLTLALLAFAAFALAMRSHHRELFGMECSRRRGRFLQVAGGALLIVSYNCLRVVWGVVEGAIGWLCLASMAAIVVVFLLAIVTSLRARQPQGGGRQGQRTSNASGHTSSPDGKS